MNLKKRKRIEKKGNHKTKAKQQPKTKWQMRLLDSYLATPSQKSQRGCSDLQDLSKPLSNVQEFPKKEKGTYDYLPDECVAEDFANGEIVWSAKYHGPAIIKQELSIDYQAEKPGIKDVNYEKKYGCKAFNIWVIEKIDDDYSDRWTTATGGGFTATALAYDLGKLTHLEKYGVDLSRI